MNDSWQDIAYCFGIHAKIPTNTRQSIDDCEKVMDGLAGVLMSYGTRRTIKAIREYIAYKENLAIDEVMSLKAEEEHKNYILGFYCDHGTEEVNICDDCAYKMINQEDITLCGQKWLDTGNP